MPKLGAALDFVNLEARNMAVHNAGAGPSSPVKGQLWFNNTGGVNELFYWDGTIWQSAKSGAGSSGPPSGPAGGDLSSTYPNPTIGAGRVTSSHIADGTVTDTDVAPANKDGAVGTYSMRTLGAGAQQAMAGNTRLNQVPLPSGGVSLNSQSITALADPTFATDAANKQYVDSKTPADATTSTKGIVQLAGDLAGTAASPQIAAGVITDADVNAANKDGATGTPGMRTLGFTGAKAMPGNADLATIAGNLTAAGPVFLNGQKITNLGDPSSSSDAANKFYVDTVATGLDAKPSVRCATTANITLSGVAAIDGITPVAGVTRVLVKNQTLGQENGIYVAQSGGWGRASDADTFAELVSAFVFVEEGTTNADSGWVCTSDAGGTIGTTPNVWTQFSGAGQITSGAGLTKTGNSLDVGQGAGITVNADTVQVANNGITNAMIADGAVDLASADVTNTLPVAKGGTGSTAPFGARSQLVVPGYHSSKGPPSSGTTWTITQASHGLSSTRGNFVQVADDTTGQVELPDVVVATNGNVTITYGASVSSNSKYVTIVGL